jgi:hypothetical protein
MLTNDEHNYRFFFIKRQETDTFFKFCKLNQLSQKGLENIVCLFINDMRMQ